MRRREQLVSLQEKTIKTKSALMDQRNLQVSSSALPPISAAPCRICRSPYSPDFVDQLSFSTRMQPLP
jgi:hypothetical protein